MTTAHVFQHKYTRIQIFVYHVNDEFSAKLKFYDLVKEHTDWMYLGTRQVIS